MEKALNNHVTKKDLNQLKDEFDQKFVTKVEFSAAMERIDKTFVTKVEFNAALDRIDKRFDSLTEMIASIAETLTSLNIFMKEHVRQQGLLHVRIDQRLDRLEEGTY